MNELFQKLYFQNYITQIYHRIPCETYVYMIFHDITCGRTFIAYLEGSNI